VLDQECILAENVTVAYFMILEKHLVDPVFR
jgi:hypothetical protein